MADVTCSRCGNTGAGLDQAPMPGKVGERILGQACAVCWKEWLGMQVKIINEYRLSPADPRHFDSLVAQMSAFLNLRDE